MSRTKHHRFQRNQHCGHDLWSRRPCSQMSYTTYNKELTIKIERAREAQLLYKIAEENRNLEETKLRLLKEKEIAFNNYRELNDFSSNLGHFIGMVGSPSWKAQLSKLVNFYNEHNPPVIKELPVATTDTEFEITTNEVEELFKLLNS